ncbi:MAG: serine/threonine-protein kinase PknK, partial [Cyanobacteria bacterium P01_F01_bin.86]
MATSFNNHSQPWFQLPGYTYIEGIHQGTHSIVYRALQAETKCPVIIKVLRQEHPSFAELVQFRNQYTITQNLAITGIVQPLSLANDGHRYALVMEDVGSISLAQYASQRALTLADVLAIALQLADILHALHQHRIIHKDIKPANILIHPESKRVHLIDFSLASLLPKETQVIQSPNTLEGTLAYLAPEQTGRMNRGIDYRADFYGLGVTLYELLTGELPFQSDDPMELIHCHIAKPPSFEFGSRNTLRQEQSSTEVGNQKIGDRSQALGVRGQELGDRSQEPEDRSEIQNSKLQIPNSEFRIPNSLSDIVLKLMAKNAEDRYQSALGLKHDLQRCLSQWETFGQIEAFELGQEDRCDRFLIPEKLYGRDTEVQTLLDAFERVSQGTAELMLVAGFSGIGKTAVVNEVHKPITQQRGYFIKGKFDQFNRNIPFSAFVQAFRNLMGQLLGESDATLAAWQAKILAAVGQSGQVLIEVIPELEKIIGPQPAIPELSGIAAQNRFNLLFRKFIQLFTTSKHPLVIFLDDLQWADSASLSLFKLLIDEAENGYLLILGAYRDNEVFPNHPLVLTLDELKKKTAALQTLTLEPLSQSNIYQLVADTLRCQPNVAAPLAESVYQKTQGNPFFTHQFLQELHSNRHISFDKTSGAWQCDLSRVGELAITDNVVEFMVGRLRQLPSPTQEVLKLSACIGNQFDLQTLAVVCECSQAEAAANLWPSLQMGLVVPAHNTYKFLQGNLEDIALANVLTDRIKVTYRFLHDCVQKSAYT